MTRIVLDKVTVEKLKDAHGDAELCDVSGTLLGFFTRASSKHQNLEPKISKEEIERRLREDERLSTSQVLAHLESL